MHKASPRAYAGGLASKTPVYNTTVLMTSMFSGFLHLFPSSAEAAERETVEPMSLKGQSASRVWPRLFNAAKLMYNSTKDIRYLEWEL